MNSEAAEAGLYLVEKSENSCIVETRACNSPLLWSLFIASMFGLFAWALYSIAWVLLQLPSARFVALVASIPAIIYWWQMPRDWAKRLASFGRRLELDRGAAQVRHTQIFLFGLKKVRRWRFDQVTEIVQVGYPGMADRLAFRFEAGQSIVSDRANFNLEGLLMLLAEYAPSLPLKRS